MKKYLLTINLRIMLFSLSSPKTVTEKLKKFKNECRYVMS